MVRITSQLAAALRFHASIATHRAYRNAEIAIDSGKVTPGLKEAWHIAQLCASIGRMVPAWRRELLAEVPNATLSMSSIFTHQRPYVRWPNRNRHVAQCELADLLVAVIDRRANPAKGIAILVQAKLSDGETVTLKSNEEKQLHLLSTRPIFDVVRVTGPTQVDLKGASPDSALLYGLASKGASSIVSYPGWPSYKTWLAADSLQRLGATAPPHKITASETLSSVLVGLFQGSYGWEFDLSPKGSDWTYFLAHRQPHDWSLLINYLLEQTFAANMPRSLRLPSDRDDRGKEEPLYWAAQSPRNASMFLLTDGYNQLNHLPDSTGDGSNIPDWTPSSFDLSNGDGGGTTVVAGDTDEPGEGPISAMIVEIGTQN